MSEKTRETNVYKSGDIKDKGELDSTRTGAGASLLPPTDFVFEVNGDVYKEERIR